MSMTDATSGPHCAASSEHADQLSVLQGLDPQECNANQHCDSRNSSQQEEVPKRAKIEAETTIVDDANVGLKAASCTIGTVEGANADTGQSVSCNHKEEGKQSIEGIAVASERIEEICTRCTTPDCSRYPWRPGYSCCRTCTITNGYGHGEECDRREEFSCITGNRDNASWFLNQCGGHLDAAVERFLVTENFCSVHSCTAFDAWNILEEARWEEDLASAILRALREFCSQNECEERFAREYLQRANWSVELASVEFRANIKVVKEFCSLIGCGEGEAWKFVKTADWNVEQAVLDYARKDDVFHIACPYKVLGDCDQVWPVSHEDLNCRKVRCGIVKWKGDEHQLPRHGLRGDVERYLRPDGRGWPGEVFGCGRPFHFPDPASLVPGNQYDGIFLSWDDRIQGSLSDVLTADPGGDYSRVAP